MSSRLEELERDAKDIRDFIIDVYEDPPIGPLLFAYEKAIAELARKQRRGRVVWRLLARFASRLRAVRWKDERNLMRVLDGPFAILFILLVQRIKSGNLSPRQAATRWAREVSEANKLAGPNPAPLRINLDSLEAAFTRAVCRYERFATICQLRRGRRRS